MDENNENPNSQNEESGKEDLENLDAAALKEKLQKTEEANRQLFERAKKAEGELKEFKSKKPEPEKKPEASEKSNEVDFGQLAYLATKGIEDPTDVEYLKKVMDDTGKNLVEVLNSSYVKAELKDRAEARNVANATPSGSRRSTGAAVDSVEYHLAKYLQTGKLPADREMAEKVVNARLHQETSKSQFTDEPVIG